MRSLNSNKVYTQVTNLVQRDFPIFKYWGKRKKILPPSPSPPTHTMGWKTLGKTSTKTFGKKRKNQTNKHNPYDADSEFKPEQATGADERRVFLPLPAPSLHNTGYFSIFKQLTRCLQITFIVSFNSFYSCWPLFLKR